MKRPVVIPYVAIPESIFFRSTAAFAGYGFAKTDDVAYLLIAVIYLVRNIWWAYSEYLGSNEAAEAYVRRKLPKIHSLTQIDPEAKWFMLTGVRISTTIMPLIPPFLYPALGYAAAFERAEIAAFATIIILMIGRVAELICEVNSTEK